MHAHTHLSHNDELLNDGCPLLWNVVVEDAACNPVTELEGQRGRLEKEKRMDEVRPRTDERERGGSMRLDRREMGGREKGRCG